MCKNKQTNKKQKKKRYFIASKTSMARPPIARLPWLIRTRS